LPTFQALVNLLFHDLPLIVGVLPLLAAALAGLGHQQRPCYWLATGLLACDMLLGGYLLLCTYKGNTWHGALTWLCIPDSPSPFRLMLSFFVDFPVAIMVCLTTTVGFVTHLYALAYLQAARQRYCVLTGGFLSAMLGFLMAENLIARFIGWEIIGLGSYLLISFWHQQENTARSGTKVWLINQLGSMSLLTGILMIGSQLGSFDLDELAVRSIDTSYRNGWLVVAKYCLLGGVCAKSAQLPWSSWLPSAMTAPIPASALIHTATMVGAGIYLLVGLAPVLGIEMLTFVAYLGSLTAFMGAYAALAQQNMKHVLAYSTISQMGYTVMAVGVGASGVGLFHFITHAFCKACLFLCTGSAARFLHQQGEAGAMQHMGGLYKSLPGTFCTYLIAACSLIGVPGFAGSLSKEAILACSLAWANQQAQAGSYLGYCVPMLGFFSAFLAVIYMGRQCYLVFMSTPRWSHQLVSGTPYRTPWLMRLSMTTLALYSFSWLYSPPVSECHSSWLLQQLAHAPRLASNLLITSALQHGVALTSVIMLALGVLVLVIWQVRNPATLLLPHNKLALHGWYLNKLVNVTARGLLKLSRLTAQFEYLVVNGLVRGLGIGYIMLSNMVSWLDRKVLGGVVLLVTSIPRYLGKVHQATQQGDLQASLLWMLMTIGLLAWGIYWATQGIG
jgi:NADH-quinone oxidoreductase subunit L